MHRLEIEEGEEFAVTVCEQYAVLVFLLTSKFDVLGRITPEACDFGYFRKSLSKNCIGVWERKRGKPGTVLQTRYTIDIIGLSVEMVIREFVAYIERHTDADGQPDGQPGDVKPLVSASADEVPESGDEVRMNHVPGF